MDNFLDGGYHVPHMHKGLNSVLDYTNYTIENVDRCCVQSSPVAVDKSSEASAAATRKGDRAYYFWQYPNFMLNWYEGYLDTNLVIPLGVDRCEVIFDFYFGDTSEAQMPYIRESMGVSERVQQEDIVICDGVQRGLSFARVSGRAAIGAPRSRRTFVPSFAGRGFERHARRSRAISSLGVGNLPATRRGCHPEPAAAGEGSAFLRRRRAVANA